MAVVVHGRMTICPEMLEETRSAAIQVGEASRADPGCNEYLFTQDLVDPAVLILAEEWASAEALQAHLATPRFAALPAVCMGDRCRAGLPPVRRPGRAPAVRLTGERCRAARTRTPNMVTREIPIASRCLKCQVSNAASSLTGTMVREDPLCRTLLVKITHQQDCGIPARVPGAEHPAYERAGDPRPLRPPGKRHALPNRQPSHQHTCLPGRLAPGNHAGRRADTPGCTLDSGANVKPGTPRNGHRNPLERLPTPLPGPITRPLCVRGHRNNNALQRYKVTHDGTEKKRPASARIRS